jgi:hypothetical protein
MPEVSLVGATEGHSLFLLTIRSPRGEAITRLAQEARAEREVLASSDFHRRQTRRWGTRRGSHEVNRWVFRLERRKQFAAGSSPLRPGVRTGLRGAAAIAAPTTGED